MLRLVCRALLRLRSAASFIPGSVRLPRYLVGSGYGSHAFVPDAIRTHHHRRAFWITALHLPRAYAFTFCLWFCHTRLLPWILPFWFLPHYLHLLVTCTAVIPRLFYTVYICGYVSFCRVTPVGYRYHCRLRCWFALYHNTLHGLIHATVVYLLVPHYYYGLRTRLPLLVGLRFTLPLDYLMPVHLAFQFTRYTFSPVATVLLRSVHLRFCTVAVYVATFTGYCGCACGYVLPRSVSGYVTAVTVAVTVLRYTFYALRFACGFYRLPHVICRSLPRTLRLLPRLRLSFCYTVTVLFHTVLCLRSTVVPLHVVGLRSRFCIPLRAYRLRTGCGFGRGYYRWFAFYIHGWLLHRLIAVTRVATFTQFLRLRLLLRIGFPFLLPFALPAVPFAVYRCSAGLVTLCYAHRFYRVRARLSRAVCVRFPAGWFATGWLRLLVTRLPLHSCLRAHAHYTVTPVVVTCVPVYYLRIACRLPVLATTYHRSGLQLPATVTPCLGYTIALPTFCGSGCYTRSRCRLYHTTVLQLSYIAVLIAVPTFRLRLYRLYVLPAVVPTPAHMDTHTFWVHGWLYVTWIAPLPATVTPGSAILSRYRYTHTRGSAV